MKTLLCLFLLFLNGFSTLGQTHQACLPPDDAYPLAAPLRHMAVGQLQEISCQEFCSHSNWQIVSIQNGRLDSLQLHPDEEFRHYVVPAAPGPVVIHTVCKVLEKGRQRIIEAATTFEAITPPSLEVRFGKSKYTKNAKVRFRLLDASTGKALPKRYSIGRFFDVQIYDDQQQPMGTIHLQSGSTLSLSRLSVKPGYTLRFTLPIRDFSTGVLFYTEELNYTF